MSKSVAVTGGNGRLGRAALAAFNDAGYRTVDIARGKRREKTSDEYRTTDLTNAGEVYGSLAAADVDRIVHAGTIPNSGSHPAHVTYGNNVMSTYHVLEAASALDIDSVCIASSFNAIGAFWQPSPVDIEYLPVDEDHPARPQDPYGLAKYVVEATADGFGRRPEGPDTIVSLRYPWITTDQELQETFRDPVRTLESVDHEDTGGGRDDLFSYLHVDDAARAAQSAIEADFEGHERFWIASSDTTMDILSSELVSCYPGVTDPGLEGHESLVDTSKAKAMLDWSASTSWRDL